MRRHSPAAWISRLLAAGLLSALALFGASCGGSETPSERLGVVVTIAPLAEFVENAGGDRVTVTVMIPPGASPHTYEPTPSQIAALSRAGMYAKVGSGVEFELAWMDKLAQQNTDMLVVDCSKGIGLLGETSSTAPGTAGAEGQHGPAEPHIWMSPLNAQVMVENICSGLVQIDPANRDYYRENSDAYLEQLTNLDREIREALAGLENHRFIVYHPFLAYFAEEYGLTMIAIEEEGKEPTAAGIARLIEEAKEHGIEVIFASPQFNPQSAEVIAGEIGGRVVFIDPLARDYAANLQKLLDELVQALE